MRTKENTRDAENSVAVLLLQARGGWPWPLGLAIHLSEGHLAWPWGGDRREQQGRHLSCRMKPVLMRGVPKPPVPVGPTAKAFVRVLCDSFLEPYGPALHSLSVLVLC